MRVSRTDLLDTLLAVSPALAAKSAVGALNMIWFEEDLAYATNGIIGIELPFSSPLRGGLEAPPLRALLESLIDDEIDLKLSSSETAIFTTENTVAELPILTPDHTIWRFPEAKSKSFFDIDEAFIDALRPMMMSISANSKVPDRAGLTISVGDDSLELFSTDGATLSRFQCPANDQWPQGRWVFPLSYCEQLRRRLKDGGRLALSEHVAVAESSPDERIYSTLIEMDAYTNYERILGPYLPSNLEEVAVDVPADLAAALKRSLALGTKSYLEFKFREEGLSFEIEGKRRLREWLPLGAPVPRRTLTLSIDLVKRALEYSQRMFPVEGALILLGDDGFMHLIATK